MDTLTLIPRFFLKELKLYPYFIPYKLDIRSRYFFYVEKDKVLGDILNICHDCFNSKDEYFIEYSLHDTNYYPRIVQIDRNLYIKIQDGISDNPSNKNRVSIIGQSLYIEDMATNKTILLAFIVIDIEFLPLTMSNLF